MNFAKIRAIFLALSCNASLLISPFLIALTHYVINHEEIPLGERFDFTDKDSPVGEKRVWELWNEDNRVHGTYRLEQQLLSYAGTATLKGSSRFSTRISKRRSLAQGS